MIVPFLNTSISIYQQHIQNNTGSPSISQLDRPVHASDNNKQSRNRKPDKHEHHTLRDRRPATILLFLLRVGRDVASGSVEAVSDDKLECEESEQYDGDCARKYESAKKEA
jgi:hypothetical protein